MDGFSYMTELTQGICYFDAICTSQTQPVLSALTMWKKLYFTYFGIVHLLLSCWDDIAPGRTRGISTFDEIVLISTRLHKDLSLDIIVMSCWGIWSVRNDKIFRSESPAIDSWKFHLSEELWAVQLRAKEGKANRIKEWTDFNL